MALGDVRIVSPGGNNLPPAQKFKVQAGATTINAGEPVAISGTYAIPLADALPTTASPVMVGIASSTSNETATVDGDVWVDLAVSGLVLEAAATSFAAVDTQAEIDAMLNNLVLFNLASGVYTIDTAVVAAGNGLRIVGGNPTQGTVQVLVRSSATALD
jgi:hypothetical protein